MKRRLLLGLSRYVLPIPRVVWQGRLRGATLYVCWFASAEMADGSAGHLELTITVRVYGEWGNVNRRMYLPGITKRATLRCAR